MKKSKLESFEMHNYNGYLILVLIAFSLHCFVLQATGSLSTKLELRNEIRIGAILDETSRPGKEAKVAIDLAIQDFKIKTNQHVVLYLQKSRNKPYYAAIAAKELIDKHNVKGILGGHTWEEAAVIAEIISEVDQDIDIPLFVSLAPTTPLQKTNQWPFFVQSVPTQSTQMKAVAAILNSWGIRNVSLIHETSHLATSSESIISYLSEALQQTGSDLTDILPLTSSSCSFDEELEVLKQQQRKIFVIHTSLELSVRLFQTAEKMGMTGYGYAWIATNEITDYLPSVHPTIIYSLKGMLGVKTSISENTMGFQHFRKKFRQKFNSGYPNEEQEEPGIFAVQGYNSAISMLEKNFQQWTPNPKTAVEIVYVIGKGYHNVYWTEGSGFSETIDNEATTTYADSIDSLQEVLFPVGPWYAYKYSRKDFGSLQVTHKKVPCVCRFAKSILQGLHLSFCFIVDVLAQVFGFIWYLVETILYSLFLVFHFIFNGLEHVLGFIWYLAKTILYGLSGFIWYLAETIQYGFPLLFRFIFDRSVHVWGFIWYLAKTILYGSFQFTFDCLGKVSGFIQYLAKTVLYGFSLLFHFTFDGLIQVSDFVWYLTKTIQYGFSLLFHFTFDGLIQVSGFVWYLTKTILYGFSLLFHFIFDRLVQVSSFIWYLLKTHFIWFVSTLPFHL